MFAYEGGGGGSRPISEPMLLRRDNPENEIFRGPQCTVTSYEHRSCFLDEHVLRTVRIYKGGCLHVCRHFSMEDLSKIQRFFSS
jgi:hypothetical protein